MKTVAQVLDEAEKLRAGCTERTFWKYHKLRILSQGRKVSGRGNITYFPDDTAVRLWLIHFLATQLEFSLSDISRYPWSQFEAAQVTPPKNTIPGELVLEAKNQCDKGKDKIIREIVGHLMKHLQSGTETSQRSNTWNDGQRR